MLKMQAKIFDGKETKDVNIPDSDRRSRTHPYYVIEAARNQ